MDSLVIDPITLQKTLWPHINLYDKQEEIFRSAWNNDITLVPAGHMLGKDFLTGLFVLCFFLSRHPCRVVTTSVDSTQLEGVLWGEIRRFIQSAAHPLNAEQGGPLVVNHLHLRKIVNGQVDGLSYVIGRVAAKGEGMAGHHIARTGDGIRRTAFIADEASGVDDESERKASTWANTELVIGNPYPCTNFFRRGVRDGDLLSADGSYYIRKVINIRAEDSPNVKHALKEITQGKKPSLKVVTPGVLGYDDYYKRRKLWDKVLQCVGLDAQFYEGAENLLYPPDWLNRAEQYYDSLPKKRRALAIGCDPGEGGANTCWAVVDKFGLIELVSKSTPDTSVIPRETLALMKKWSVSAEYVGFDRGGGGKQHADFMRLHKHNVRTIAFGESLAPDPRRRPNTTDEKKEIKEVRYVYKNRRAEMYGNLSLLLDPHAVDDDGVPRRGYALPREYIELRRQLSLIPRLFDGEGRLYLPPKSKPSANSTIVTLTEMLGCSPDEADALVVANYVMFNKPARKIVGAMG